MPYLFILAIPSFLLRMIFLRLQFQQLQQLLMILRVDVFDGAFAQRRRRSVPRPQRFDVGGLLVRQLLISLNGCLLRGVGFSIRFDPTLEPPSPARRSSPPRRAGQLCRAEGWPLHRPVIASA